MLNKPKGIKLKKAKTLYTLTLLLLLSACHSNEVEYFGCSKVKTDDSASVDNKAPEKDQLDTVRVIGVWGDKPNSYKPVKETMVVYKDGSVKDGYITYERTDKGTSGFYFERGDTIVLRDNKFVENLTMKRIAAEYVNGR